LAIESPSNEAVENPLLVINQIIKKQGPLIKSPDEDLPQDTQQDQSSAKGEDL